jgi:hypothetical protein
VIHVEIINTNGKIDKMFFIKPQISYFIKQQELIDFLYTADISTVENKYQSFHSFMVNLYKTMEYN